MIQEIKGPGPALLKIRPRLITLPGQRRCKQQPYTVVFGFGGDCYRQSQGASRPPKGVRSLLCRTSGRSCGTAPHGVVRIDGSPGSICLPRHELGAEGRDLKSKRSKLLEHRLVPLLLGHAKTLTQDYGRRNCAGR